jgi:hypothetical protein
MTIEKTVGVGGDYANIGALWDALSLPDGGVTWSDNYHAVLVSGFTEPPKSFLAAPYYNGHTLTIENPNNYVISMNGSTTYDFPVRGIVLPGTSGAVVDGLIIALPTSGSAAPVFNIRPQWVDQSVLITYKNIKIIAQTNSAVTGISLFGVGLSTVRVLNCRFHGIGIGIKTGYYGWGITTNKYIEDCVSHSCIIGISFGNHANYGAVIKNVSCFDSSNKDFNTEGGASTTSLTNCADSDNSIASSGGILTDNITGITEFDFLSVDPDSVDFLKIGKKWEWVPQSVGLWKGENNGNDEVYGNTAILGPGIGYEAGVIGNCFHLIGYTATKKIQYNSNYNFGVSGHFSFEFYFRYSSTGGWLRFGCHIASGFYMGYWKNFAVVFKSGQIAIGPNGNFPGQVYNGTPINQFMKLKLTYFGNSRWELYINDVLQIPSQYQLLPFIDKDDTDWYIEWTPESGQESDVDEFTIINDRYTTQPLEEYSALYKTGTTNISEWNTSDAFGNSRPDFNGQVSIGIHEPLPLVIVKFINKTTGEAGDHFLWTFGDSTTSASMDATVYHAYNLGRDYTASLEGWSVTDQYRKKTKIVSIPL